MVMFPRHCPANPVQESLILMLINPALAGIVVELIPAMAELKCDHPIPEPTEREDAETLAAIAEGIEQLDAGHGVPIEELRKEFTKRCSK